MGYCTRNLKKKLVWLTALLFLLTSHGVLAANGIINNQSSDNKLPVFQNPLDPIDNPTDLVRNVTNYVAGFIGSLAVLVLVWGAIVFITSRGDPGQVQKAKNIVLYAVIGLAIAALGSGLVDIITWIIKGTT